MQGGGFCQHLSTLETLDWPFLDFRGTNLKLQMFTTFFCVSQDLREEVRVYPLLLLYYSQAYS